MGLTNFRIVRLRRKDLEKLKETGEKRDIEVATQTRTWTRNW